MLFTYYKILLIDNYNPLNIGSCHCDFKNMEDSQEVLNSSETNNNLLWDEDVKFDEDIIKSVVSSKQFMF